MPHVVSVSLGSSKRDKVVETEVLGRRFLIERRGTDGSRERFRSLMLELDGHVDALGVGGADIWLSVGDRRYEFREIAQLVAGVRRTPVVDGSGLKHTLEREAVARIGADGLVDWPNERALLVSAVDRFGMAQALARACPHVVYGDLLFGVGLPVPIRSFPVFEALARTALPVVTRLPFQWFYPTGERQDERKPKFRQYFDEATVVCGDWHYIRRYAPDRMEGKTVLTQTLRRTDLEWLATTGVRQVVATTPVLHGETFATNVMEGVLLTLMGKRPEEAAETDYLDWLEALGWRPTTVWPVQSA